MNRLLGSGAALFRPALWWMVPAWLIGHVRPGLARATDADALALGAGRPAVVGVLLPGVAIIVGLVPSALHATLTTFHVGPDVEYLRIRIDYVYTESLLLMAGAVLMGVLSAALGTFFVLTFAVFDLFAASRHIHQSVPFPDALIGHVIAYWLLWLLVVEIPVFGRSLAESGLGGRSGRLRAALIGGAATGGFVFLWTLAVPTLIRPVYTLPLVRNPQYAGVAPLQVAGWTLAIAAAVAAFLLIVRRGEAGLLGREPGRAGWWRRRDVRIAQHVVVAALLTIGVSGLIIGPRDAVLLFGAFLLTRPAAELLVTRTGLVRLTSRLPAVVRVGLAVAVAFAVALTVVPALYTPDDEDFLSVIVGLIGAIFAVELVAADRSEPVTPTPASPSVSPIVAGLLGGLGMLALSVLAPSGVSADNCADPGDCYGLGAGAALAAAGGGAMIASRRRPPSNEEDLKRKKLDYVEKQMKKDPDNPYWQRQHKYWSGDTSPTSDDKPTSAEAFPSSGAATKG